MSGRQIWVSSEVASVLRSLHPDIKKKIKAGFKDILANPESGKLLRDELKGFRSMRVGRFRIIYRASIGNIVEIAAVGPREVIYEETYRLLKR